MSANILKVTNDANGNPTIDVRNDKLKGFMRLLQTTPGGTYDWAFVDGPRGPTGHTSVTIHCRNPLGNKVLCNLVQQYTNVIGSLNPTEWLSIDTKDLLSFDDIQELFDAIPASTPPVDITWVARRAMETAKNCLEACRSASANGDELGVQQYLAQICGAADLAVSAKLKLFELFDETHDAATEAQLTTTSGYYREAVLCQKEAYLLAEPPKTSITIRSECATLFQYLLDLIEEGTEVDFYDEPVTDPNDGSTKFNILNEALPAILLACIYKTNIKEPGSLSFADELSILALISTIQREDLLTIAKEAVIGASASMHACQSEPAGSPEAKHYAEETKYAAALARLAATKLQDLGDDEALREGNQYRDEANVYEHEAEDYAFSSSQPRP